MGRILFIALIIVYLFQLFELLGDAFLAFSKDIREQAIQDNLKTEEEKEEWIKNLLIDIFNLRLIFVMFITIILLSQCS